MGDVMMGARLIRNLARSAQDEFPWLTEVPGAGNLLPSRHYVRREPIGVCVGIVRWNFPRFTMAIWKVAMAAMMGNSVILKPASETPLSALALAKVVAASKVPKGVINVISGPGGVLGEVLCTHPKVDKGGLHRLDRGRRSDHGHGVEDHQEGHARAGRKVSQHRPR